MVSGIDQRELGRKERATAEYYRQLRRYGYECGDVITYKLSPEQLLQVLTGEKTVEDFIREGAVSGS
nr:MAG TPA: Sterol carrier protein domain [Caudoviricetes sp.]